jgi:predicted double-glycine peptidase
MNPAETEHPGTGGGLRYITEEAALAMVNQEQSHSCQAACARQLLKDAGVDVSEDDLLANIGYHERYGTTVESTATVLTMLHPKLDYSGGEIREDALAILCRRDPWIANLRTDRGTVHSVIVDRLESDIVHVRDPWGLDGPGSEKGTIATIKLDYFLQHWHWAFYTGVIPVRRKGGT